MLNDEIKKKYQLKKEYKKQPGSMRANHLSTISGL
jgi:hypothetical protein